MNKAQKLINRIMMENGLRHKYQVAEYFGVTPQAISTWLTKGEVPSKHQLKVQSEFKHTEIPYPLEPTSEDKKTVIDYLISENVTLKNQIVNLKAELQMSKSKRNDDLISKINSKSLVLKGRVTDGMITEIGGDWHGLLGYKESDLVNHKYDEGFIHKEDAFKIKQNQANLLRSTGLKESRFSTIRRWKHKKNKEYIMLCMVWYVDVENDEIEIIAKPIDHQIQDTLFAS